MPSCSPRMIANEMMVEPSELAMNGLQSLVQSLMPWITALPDITRILIQPQMNYNALGVISIRSLNASVKGL